MFHQGLMFHRTKRYHEALRMFSKVEELLPGDRSVYIERGLVYQDMGNHNYAIQDFEQAIKIDPNHAMSYFHLGVSRLRSRHVRDAEDDFKESL